MEYEYPDFELKEKPEFITDKRLSIIVPYRDRAVHLKQFSSHILRYFMHDKDDRNIPFAVTVVEQEAGTPFNAGALKNVGARLTKGADYFCFHDVDYLPIWADYSYATKPTRIVWRGAHMRPYVPGGKLGAHHIQATFWGGVVAVNKADLALANGYSNQYWGWGSEDDDFRNRLEVEKLLIEHRDGYFDALDHLSAGYDPAGAVNEVGAANHKKREKLLYQMVHNQGHKTDGLSNVQYDVLEHYKRKERIAPEDCPANLLEWQHVKVRLKNVPTN